MQHMRITNGFLNERVLDNLFTNRNKLVKLQEQISSGKKVDEPSDDVFSAMKIMTNTSAMGKVDSYISNINSAKSELEMVDSSLSNAVDSVHKVRELTIQALNATSGSDQLNIIKEEMDRIADNIRDIGNTKFGKEFIFGGKVTDTAPFETTGTPGEIKYVGSDPGDGQRNIEIAEGVTVNYNLNGDEIFGHYYDDSGTMQEKGLIATLNRLSNAMDGTNTDKSLIRDELENLETDLATVLNAKSEIGSLASRLEMTQKTHEDNKITFTKFKSEAEDIDYAKVISELNMQESALQASLRIGAKIIQPSLLNFI